MYFKLHHWAQVNVRKTVEWLDDEQQQKTETIIYAGITELLMIANGDIQN